MVYSRVFQVTLTRGKHGGLFTCIMCIIGGFNTWKTRGSFTCIISRLTRGKHEI